MDDMFGDAGEPVEEEARELEPAQQPEEPPVEEQPPEPGQAPEPEPAPVMVPIGVLHEVRDELKAFKAEAEARKQQERPPEAVKPPDMFEDPEGWQAYQAQQFEQALYAQRLDMSHRFAVQQHGQEAVSTAVDWAKARCDADPYFNQQARSSADPIGFAVEQYRRDQIASTVKPEDFAKFQAWQQQQAAIAGQAPAAAIETPAAAPPPRSIASAPSAGGSAATPKSDPNEEKLNAMFGA